jgi:hypothetical protein
MFIIFYLHGHWFTCLIYLTFMQNWVIMIHVCHVQTCFPNGCCMLLDWHRLTSKSNCIGFLYLRVAWHGRPQLADIHQKQVLVGLGDS